MFFSFFFFLALFSPFPYHKRKPTPWLSPLTYQPEWTNYPRQNHTQMFKWTDHDPSLVRKNWVEGTKILLNRMTLLLSEIIRTNTSRKLFTHFLLLDLPEFIGSSVTWRLRDDESSVTKNTLKLTKLSVIRQPANLDLLWITKSYSSIYYQGRRIH